MLEMTRTAGGASQQPGTEPPSKRGLGVPIVQQYLRVLLRRRWYLAGAVAGGMAFALVLTLLATPRYTATTQIEISREGARIVDVRGVEPESSTQDIEFYQTQYGLLASRSLAAAVMKNLRLADNQQFLDVMGLTSVIESKGLQHNRQGRENEVVRVLLRNVNISPIRLSRLVNISFVSPDPVMSMRIANTWAEMFIQSGMDRRFQSTAHARRYLEDRLGELRKKLEDSERQAVSYAANASIINLPGVQGSSRDASSDRSLVSDNLAALNTELGKATADRIAAEARLRSGNGGASAETLDNVAINNLRERLADAQADYARLQTQFTPDYPEAQAVKARADRLRQTIAQEEERVQATLANAYRDAKIREDRLQTRVNLLKGNFNDQRRRTIQYNIYQREADTNRQLYDALLQRYKEIGVAAGIGNDTIAVVDPATSPEKPSSPKPLLNLVLGLMAGLIVGVVLALLREEFDESITDPSEVERRLGLPLLGVIPNVPNEERMEEIRDPKSGMAEAYLSVETSLGFATDHGVPRTLAITSTRPSEGKSTTAFALASWLARSGAKILLVDGDMRSPSLHDMLEVANGPGLSNILSGATEWKTAVRRDERDKLDYITAGPQPPNAADLLRGRNFEEFLAAASSSYDHIIIDSPPVMGLADAVIFGNHVDGMLFVIEAQGIKTRLAARAIERLRSSQTNLLGAVLSKFDARKSHSGYDYGYGYGYGVRYGEGAQA